MEPKALASYLPSTESGKPRDNEKLTVSVEQSRLVDELWRRMTAIYGHKWASQYGDSDADNTWAFGLDGVTGEQFADGLHHCISMSADRVRTGEEDWPPTLGEFRAFCTKPPYPFHNNVPALPTPDVPKERKLAYIAEMRAALGITKAREPGEDG